MSPSILMLITIFLGVAYTVPVDVPVTTQPPAQQQHFEWNDNDNDNGRRWIDNSAIDNVEILINENRTRSPKVVIVARKVVVQHL